MSDSNSNEKLYKGRVILACIDGSSGSEAVCDYASWIANTVDRPLKLIHSIENKHDASVTDYSGAIGLGSQQELLKKLTDVEQNRRALMIEQGQLMINAAKDRAQKIGVSNIESYQHHGSLSESLIECEDEIRVAIIGIRGKQHEDKDSGIGHQLESVIRSLHKPILVVNKEFTQPKNAMIAYDGSVSCQKALAMIVSSELFKGMTCHLVHVDSGDKTKGEELLSKAENVLKNEGFKVFTSQLEGQADQVLANYQLENNIDLTLMGAFSHNRFRDFLLGSFTAKMLTATNRPLLLLR